MDVCWFVGSSVGSLGICGWECCNGGIGYWNYGCLGLDRFWCGIKYVWIEWSIGVFIC